MCSSLNIINEMFTAEDSKRSQCDTSILSCLRRPLHCMNQNFANKLIKRLCFWILNKKKLPTLFHPNPGFCQNLIRNRNLLFQMFGYKIFNRKRNKHLKSKVSKITKKPKVFELEMRLLYWNINSNARQDRFWYDDRLFDAKTPTPKIKQNFVKLLPPSKSNFRKTTDVRHPSYDLLYFSPTSTPAGFKTDNSKLNKTFNDYVNKMERRRRERDSRPKPWRVGARTVTKMVVPSSSARRDDATNKKNRKTFLKSSFKNNAPLSFGPINSHQSSRETQSLSQKFHPRIHQTVVNDTPNKHRLKVVNTGWSPSNKIGHNKEAHVTREMPDRTVVASQDSNDSESCVRFISTNKINSKKLGVASHANSWTRRFKTCDAHVKVAHPCDSNKLDQKLKSDNTGPTALNYFSSTYGETSKEECDLPLYEQIVQNGTLLLEQEAQIINASIVQEKDTRQQRRGTSFSEKKGSRQYRSDCVSRLVRSGKETIRSPICIRQNSSTRGSFLRKEMSSFRESDQRKQNRQTQESYHAEDQTSAIASKEMDENFTTSSKKRIIENSREKSFRNEKKYPHLFGRSRDRCKHSEFCGEDGNEPCCLQNMDDVLGLMRLKDINDIAKARTMMDAYTKFLQREKVKSFSESDDNECMGPNETHCVEKSEVGVVDNTEKVISCFKQCVNDVCSQDSTFLTHNPSNYSEKLTGSEMGSPSNGGEVLKTNVEKHPTDSSSPLENHISNTSNDNKIKTSKFWGDMAQLISNSEHSDKQGDMDKRLLGRLTEHSLSKKLGRTVIRHSMPSLFLKMNQDVSKKVRSIVNSYSKFLQKEKENTINEPVSYNMMGCTLNHEENFQAPHSGRDNDSAVSSVRYTGQVKSSEITESEKYKDVAEITSSDASNYTRYLETSTRFSKSSTASNGFVGQAKKENNFGNTSKKYKGSRIPVSTTLRKRTFLSQLQSTGQAKLNLNPIDDKIVKIDNEIESNSHTCDAEAQDNDKKTYTTTLENHSIEKALIEQEAKTSNCQKTVIKSSDCFTTQKKNENMGHNLPLNENLFSKSKINNSKLLDLDIRIRDEKKQITDRLDKTIVNSIQQFENLTFPSVLSGLQETKRTEEQNELIQKKYNYNPVDNCTEKVNLKSQNLFKTEVVNNESSVKNAEKDENDLNSFFCDKTVDCMKKYPQSLKNTKNDILSTPAALFADYNSKMSSSVEKTSSLFVSPSFKSTSPLNIQQNREKKYKDIISSQTWSPSMLNSKTTFTKNKHSGIICETNQFKSKTLHCEKEANIDENVELSLNDDYRGKLGNDKKRKDISMQSISELKEDSRDSVTSSYISNHQKHKRPISYLDIYMQSKLLHSQGNSEERRGKSLHECSHKSTQKQKCTVTYEPKQTPNETSVDCNISKEAENATMVSTVPIADSSPTFYFNCKNDEHWKKEKNSRRNKLRSIATSNKCNLQETRFLNNTISLIEDLKEKQKYVSKTDCFFGVKISKNHPDNEESLSSVETTKSSPLKFTNDYSTPSFKSTCSFNSPKLKETASVHEYVCNPKVRSLLPTNKSVQQETGMSKHKASFEFNQICIKNPSPDAIFLTPKHMLPSDDPKKLQKPKCLNQKDRRVRFSPLLFLGSETDSDEDTRALVDSITSSWGDESEPEHLASNNLEEVDTDKEYKWSEDNKASGGFDKESYCSLMQENKAEKRFSNDVKRTCSGKIQHIESFKRSLEDDRTPKDEFSSEKSSDSTMRNIPDLDGNHVSGSFTSSFPSNSLIVINAEEQERLATKRSTQVGLNYNYSNKALRISTSDPCLSSSTEMSDLSLLLQGDEISVTKSVSDTLLLNAYVNQILNVLQKLKDQKHTREGSKSKNKHRETENNSNTNGYKICSNKKRDGTECREIETKAILLKRTTEKPEPECVKCHDAKAYYKEHPNDIIKTADTLSSNSFFSIPSSESSIKSELSKSKKQISSTDDSPRYFPGFSEILSFWESRFGSLNYLKKKTLTQENKTFKNKKVCAIQRLIKERSPTAQGNIESYKKAECKPRSTCITSKCLQSTQNNVNFIKNNEKKLFKGDGLNTKIKSNTLKTALPQASKRRGPPSENKFKKDNVADRRIEKFGSVSSVAALSPRKLKNIKTTTEQRVKQSQETYSKYAIGSEDTHNRNHKAKKQYNNKFNGDSAQNHEGKKYSPEKTLNDGIKQTECSNTQFFVKSFDNEIKAKSPYRVVYNTSNLEEQNLECQRKREYEKNQVFDQIEPVETHYLDDDKTSYVAQKYNTQFMYSSSPSEKAESLSSAYPTPDTKQVMTPCKSKQQCATMSPLRTNEVVTNLVRFDELDDDEIYYPISCGLDIAPSNIALRDTSSKNNKNWDIASLSFFTHKHGQRQLKIPYAPREENKQSCPSVKHESRFKKIVELGEQKSCDITKLKEQCNIHQIRSREKSQNSKRHTTQDKANKSYLAHGKEQKLYIAKEGKRSFPHIEGRDKDNGYTTNSSSHEFESKTSQVDRKKEEIQQESYSTEWETNKYNPSQSKSSAVWNEPKTYDIQSQEYSNRAYFANNKKTNITIQDQFYEQRRNDKLDNKSYTIVNKEEEPNKFREECKACLDVKKVNERFSKLYFQPILTVGKSPTNFLEGIPAGRSATKSSSSFCCLINSPLSEDVERGKILSSISKTNDYKLEKEMNITKCIRNFAGKCLEISSPSCVSYQTHTSDHSISSQNEGLNRLKAPKSQILHVIYHCKNQDNQKQLERFTNFKTKEGCDEVERSHTQCKKCTDLEIATSITSDQQIKFENRCTHKNKVNLVTEAIGKSSQPTVIRKYETWNVDETDSERHEPNVPNVEKNIVISKEKATSTQDLKIIRFKSNKQKSSKSVLNDQKRSLTKDEDMQAKKKYIKQEQIADSTFEFGIMNNRKQPNKQENNDKSESVSSIYCSWESACKNTKENQEENSQSFKSQTQSVVPATCSEISDTFHSYLPKVKRSGANNTTRSFSDSDITKQVCIIDSIGKRKCAECFKSNDKCSYCKEVQEKKCPKNGNTTTKHTSEREDLSALTYSNKLKESDALNDITDFGKTSECILGRSKKESNETAGTRNSQAHANNSKLSNDCSTFRMKSSSVPNKANKGKREKKRSKSEKNTYILNSPYINPYNTGCHEERKTLLSYMQNDEIRRWLDSVQSEMVDKSFNNKIYAKIRSPRQRGTEDVEVVLNGEVPVKNIVASLIRGLPRSSGSFERSPRSKSKSSHFSQNKVFITVKNSDQGHSQNPNHSLNNENTRIKNINSKNADGGETRKDSISMSYRKDETSAPLSNSNFSIKGNRDSNESLYFEEGDEQKEVKKFHVRASDLDNVTSELKLNKLNNDSNSTTIPNTSTWGTGTLATGKTGNTSKLNPEKKDYAIGQKFLNLSTKQNDSKVTVTSGENIATDQICVMAPCSFPIRNKRVSANLSSNSVTKTKRVELTFVDKKTLQSSTIYVKPRSKHDSLWPKIVSRKGYVFVTFEHEEFRMTNSQDKCVKSLSTPSKRNVSTKIKSSFDNSEKTKSFRKYQSSLKMDSNEFDKRNLHKVGAMINKKLRYSHNRKCKRILQVLDRHDSQNFADNGSKYYSHTNHGGKVSSSNRDFQLINPNESVSSTLGDDYSCRLYNSSVNDKNKSENKNLDFDRSKKSLNILHEDKKSGEVAKTGAECLGHAEKNNDLVTCYGKKSLVDLDLTNQKTNAYISPQHSHEIKTYATNDELFPCSPNSKNKAYFGNQHENKNIGIAYKLKQYRQDDNKTLFEKQEKKSSSISPVHHFPKSSKEKNKFKSCCEDYSFIQQRNSDIEIKNQTRGPCFDYKDELQPTEKQFMPSKRSRVKVKDTSTSLHTQKQIQRKVYENKSTSPLSAIIAQTPKTQDSFDKTLHRLLKKYNRKLIHILPEQMKQKGTQLENVFLSTNCSPIKEEKSLNFLKRPTQWEENTTRWSGDTGIVNGELCIEKDIESFSDLENVMLTVKGDKKRNKSKTQENQARSHRQMSSHKIIAQTCDETKKNLQREKDNFQSFIQYQLQKLENNFEKQNEELGPKHLCKDSKYEQINKQNEVQKQGNVKYCIRAVKNDNQEYDQRSHLMRTSKGWSPDVSSNENTEEVVKCKRSKQTKDWLKSVQNKSFDTAAQKRSQNIKSQNGRQNEQSFHEESEPSEYAVKQEDSGYVTPKFNQRKTQYIFKHLPSVSCVRTIPQLRGSFNTSTNKSVGVTPRQKHCNIYSLSFDKGLAKRRRNHVISVNNKQDNKPKNSLQKGYLQKNNKIGPPNIRNRKPSEQVSDVQSLSRHEISSPVVSTQNIKDIGSIHPSTQGKNQPKQVFNRGIIDPINSSVKSEWSPRNIETPDSAISQNTQIINHGNTSDTSAQSYSVYWRQNSTDDVLSETESTFSAHLNAYSKQLNDEAYNGRNKYWKTPRQVSGFSRRNASNLASFRHSRHVNPIRYSKDNTASAKEFGFKRGDWSLQNNKKRYQAIGGTKEQHWNDGKKSLHSVRGRRYENEGRKKHVSVSPREKFGFKINWNNRNRSEDTPRQAKSPFYSSDGKSRSVSRDRYVGRKDDIRTHTNFHRFVNDDSKRLQNLTMEYISFNRQMKRNDNINTDDRRSTYDCSQKSRKNHETRNRDDRKDFKYSIHGSRNPCTRDEMSSSKGKKTFNDISRICYNNMLNVHVTHELENQVKCHTNSTENFKTTLQSIKKNCKLASGDDDSCQDTACSTQPYLETNRIPELLYIGNWDIEVMNRFEAKQQLWKLETRNLTQHK